MLITIFFLSVSIVTIFIFGLKSLESNTIYRLQSEIDVSMGQVGNACGHQIPTKEKEIFICAGPKLMYAGQSQ